MNRNHAETVVTANMKAVFGFALRRCRTPEDAEDLAQEIVLRAYQALLARNDIREPAQFLWTVAHNTLANYYREGAKSIIGVPLHEVEEVIPDPDTERNAPDRATQDEALRRMRREIAYLSETRRRVVIAYWFENRKQADIAKELDIPLGSVKWHLFEAKRELRKGMETMRQNSELTYNPIEFAKVGLSGSAGTRSISDILRSPLTQNIIYCVRRAPLTVREIADALGVSPVYVEGEIQYLEEYGLISRDGDRYLAEMLISEPTESFVIQQDKMYKSAAALVAEELFDRLSESGLLDDPSILCGQTDEPLTMTGGHKPDRNFLLWTLIPFILERSGEHLMDHRITFEEVAAIRPDGGHNFIYADVLNKNMKLPADCLPMHGWCGPMWNSVDGLVHWQIVHKWTERSYSNYVTQQYGDNTLRILSLYRREEDAPLSPDEYAFLAEQGYIKTCGDPEGHFKSAWQIVQLADRNIVNRLIAIGDEVKKNHHAELEALKAPFAEALLNETAPHMRRTRAYQMQYIFYSDAWFLLHCIEHLLRVGKLTPPTEGQRKAVTTLIYPAL